MARLSALASCGHCSQLPQTGGFKQWKSILLRSGGQKSCPMKASAGRTVLPPEAPGKDPSCLFPLLGLPLPLCSHDVLLFSPRFSCKDPCHWVQGPPT